MFSRQRKRQRQKKLIFAISIVICLVLILVYFSVGSYFFNIMLNPIDQKPLIDISAQELILPNDIKDANSIEAEIASAWAQEASRDNWSIKSEEDISLNATYYGSMIPDSEQWVIIFHGYMQSSVNMVVQTKRFYDQGFHVLVPDLRGHGRSGGNVIGMGWLDKADVVSWAREIVSKDSKAQIALYGVSIGADAIMMACGEDLPEQVYCAVEDSGYANAKELFSDRIRKVYNMNEAIPMFTSEMITRVKAGYSTSKADAIEALKKSEMPILFIGGGSDEIVPIDTLEALYISYEGEKNKLVIPGAGHVQSSLVDPELYWKAVFDFIKEYQPSEDQ